MPGRSPREKGKRWEKRICHWLQSMGFRAARLAGLRNDPDIRIELGDRCLYIEAKHQKKVNWRQAFAQARESNRADFDWYCVCAKDDRNEEVWILPKELGELFFEMLKGRKCESS